VSTPWWRSLAGAWRHKPLPPRKPRILCNARLKAVTSYNQTAEHPRTALLHIREILGWDAGRNTDCPGRSWPTRDGPPSVLSRPPLIRLPIRYLLIILSIDAVWSELHCFTSRSSFAAPTRSLLWQPAVVLQQRRASHWARRHHHIDCGRPGLTLLHLCSVRGTSELVQLPPNR
jgi:hypothetical protein